MRKAISAGGLPAALAPVLNAKLGFKWDVLLRTSSKMGRVKNIQQNGTC